MEMVGEGEEVASKGVQPFEDPRDRVAWFCLSDW